MASAQRTACDGAPSKAMRKASPIVLTSRPPKRSISRRTAVWWAPSRSRQRASPRRAAWPVEPTMSLKMTVSRSRATVRERPPVRNSSISPSMSELSTAPGRLSTPSSST